MNGDIARIQIVLTVWTSNGNRLCFVYLVHLTNFLWIGVYLEWLWFDHYEFNLLFCCWAYYIVTLLYDDIIQITPVWMWRTILHQGSRGIVHMTVYITVQIDIPKIVYVYGIPARCWLGRSCCGFMLWQLLEYSSMYSWISSLALSSTSTWNKMVVQKSGVRSCWWSFDSERCFIVTSWSHSLAMEPKRQWILWFCVKRIWQQKMVPLFKFLCMTRLGKHIVMLIHFACNRLLSVDPLPSDPDRHCYHWYSLRRKSTTYITMKMQ